MYAIITTPLLMTSSVSSAIRKLHHSDIKVNGFYLLLSAKVSCEKKWQRRWDLTNSGRDLYVYRKYVGVKSKKYVHQKYRRVMAKLRTGYCLNEYLYKIGVVDRPYCQCGEIESREHYTMECSNLQDLRERLRLKLWQQTGLYWLIEIFLTISKKDDYEQDRLIINEVFEFLERSGRLTKSKPKS